VQVPLQIDQLVSAITVNFGATAAVTPAHQWAVLLDSARKVLAFSTDTTNAAIAANAVVKYSLATPVRIASRQTYYAGYMIAAGTTPSTIGVSDFSATASALVPIFAATSTPTSVTADPAVGTTQGALTAVADKRYLTVS
jgi:hypothetical protein